MLFAFVGCSTFGSFGLCALCELYNEKSYRQSPVLVYVLLFVWYLDQWDLFNEDYWRKQNSYASYIELWNREHSIYFSKRKKRREWSEFISHHFKIMLHKHFEYVMKPIGLDNYKKLLIIQFFDVIHCQDSIKNNDDHSFSVVVVLNGFWTTFHIAIVIGGGEMLDLYWYEIIFKLELNLIFNAKWNNNFKIKKIHSILMN